jgi:hypothetical protein
MDGNTKCSRYCNCGKSLGNVASVVGKCYGKADAIVQCLHSKGELRLDVLVPNKPAGGTSGAPPVQQQQEQQGEAADEQQQQQQQQQEQQDGEGEDGEGGEEAAGHGASGGPCTTVVGCARPDAPRKPAGVDTCGVVKTVCAHGFSVLGGVVDMCQYESFPFYLVLLHQLLLVFKGKVGDVFVDFACQLRSTWTRYVAHLAASGEITPEQASKFGSIRLLVNWMHAEGHNLECQLTASGRHTQGAGRRHGENVEQIWALLKVRVPLC